MNRIKTTLFVTTAACAMGVALYAQAKQAAPAPLKPEQFAASKEWPTHGHDAGGQRHSPLTEITPANVKNLEIAWTYHMKPEGFTAAAGGGRGGGRAGDPAAAGRAGGDPAAGGRAGGRGGPGGAAGDPSLRASETTPIVADGLMYIASPYNRVVALDPVTGKEVWVYVMPSGAPSLRGLEYFAGDATTPAQILVGSNDAKLYSIDAKTGKLNPKFGTDGVLNLDTPEMTNGQPNGHVPISTPGIMYKNFLIIGSHVQEGNGPGGAGDVRAVDVHTGTFAWTFHAIPRKGEPNYGTWVGNAADKRSGVNVWGFFTVDVQRGIVYIPFGNSSGDLWGGDRPGNNLYSNSIVAADAKTGKYLWHFQLVHHDVWDYDLESPPLLMDVKQNGKTIPAVLVFNKVGLVFMLDRVTGKPIYQVEERPVAPSPVPVEQLSPTQPFPVKPAPLARMTFSMKDIATVTPEIEAACRKWITDNKIETDTPPFAPPSWGHSRVIFPSEIGGPNWGGAAFNPALGLAFIQSNQLGQVFGVQDPPSGEVKKEDIVGTNEPGGRTGPLSTTRPSGRFREPTTNMPCNAPPWGTLTAVNVNTGDIAWQVPVGVTDSLPEGKQNTGRPGMGGAISTASGLVFMGGTDDSRFRALDAKTGKELWVVKLNASVMANPSTYQGKDGRQYVAVVATGGTLGGAPLTSDEVIAFRVKK